MKRIKKESHYEKVEIIKIPYKPFRKKLYEDYSKILKDFPYWVFRKNHKPVLKAKGLHSSKIFREIPY